MLKLISDFITTSLVQQIWQARFYVFYFIISLVDYLLNKCPIYLPSVMCFIEFASPLPSPKFFFFQLGLLENLEGIKLLWLKLGLLVASPLKM